MYNASNFVIIDFVNSGQTTKVKRSFFNILGLISQYGGYITSLLIPFGLIVSCLNKNEFKNKLLKKIFRASTK